MLVFIFENFSLRHIFSIAIASIFVINSSDLAASDLDKMRVLLLQCREKRRKLADLY